ncbi:MAG: hypothetical protein KME13_06240 [Myxacorys californica WJT36-NPBG1]|nr:hypothetical protein [Myxacorys californica WJT36-NPBG1]
MTAQKDQIQALIRDIDRVLQQPSPKFSWGSGSQTDQLRQALKRVRHFLHQCLVKPIPTLNLPPALVSTENAQDIMQSVVQEMQEMRLSVLRPLHNEVSTLMQQRTALLREIRQLEARRDDYLQEQTIASRSAPETIAQLDLVHDRADQVITNLDTTLRVVFDSLQRDMQAYQDSLSHGLDNLHTLGRQSEVMFSGLLGRLAEQLGRDASSYLRPGEFPDSDDLISLAEASAALDEDGTQAETLEASGPAPQPHSQEPAIALPYAGMELQPATGSEQESASEPNTSQPDTIHTLTELFERLTISPEAPSRAQPTTRLGYPMTLSERQKTQTNSTERNSIETVPRIALPKLPSPSQSTNLPESSPKASYPPEAAQPPSIAKEAQSIFSLEGIDNLFVEEERSEPEQ